MKTAKERMIDNRQVFIPATSSPFSTGLASHDGVGALQQSTKKERQVDGWQLFAVPRLRHLVAGGHIHSSCRIIINPPKDDQVVCILKAREPARILTAIGNKKDNRWHLDKQRWVDQYDFYLNDAEWGRMFVRVCPYFPFPVRICLNPHYWIAQQMRRKGIRFRQSTRASWQHCIWSVRRRCYPALRGGGTYR